MLNFASLFFPFKVRKCAVNPCENGGTCQEHFFNGTYSCGCLPQQYTGRNCEKGIFKKF